MISFGFVIVTFRQFVYELAFSEYFIVLFILHNASVTCWESRINFLIELDLEMKGLRRCYQQDRAHWRITHWHWRLSVAILKISTVKISCVSFTATRLQFKYFIVVFLLGPIILTNQYPSLPPFTFVYNMLAICAGGGDIIRVDVMKLVKIGHQRDMDSSYNLGNLESEVFLQNSLSLLFSFGICLRFRVDSPLILGHFFGITSD